MEKSWAKTKPRALRRGARIGVISPAGPIEESDLHAGIGVLKSAGFEVRLGEFVYARESYLAGKDEDRLKDLHNMFRDGEVDAVFAARGGYGCMRLLHRIDYGLIQKNPKVLVGFSDLTALLISIYKRSGLVTVHGPMLRSLGRAQEGSLQSLLDLISEKKTLSFKLSDGSAVIPGRARGILMGGNLSLLCHLVGTPFFPSLKGCILFIEDTGEPLYRIDRMLTHLALSGQLQGLSALVTGRFEQGGESLAIDELLKDVLPDLKIPVATGLPVGHGKENVPIPLGVTAELDADLMRLSLIESCVE